MLYRIEYTATAVRALERLPHEVQGRVVAKIETLAKNPRPMEAVKLKGHGAYRVRVGDYRVIYAVEEEKLVVLVVDVGHRREVYRDW